MKKLKEIKTASPEEVTQMAGEYVDRISDKKTSKSLEKEILDELKSLENKPAKLVAIEVAGRGKIISAIPELYSLLKDPFVNQLGSKQMDPASAMIEMGKKGTQGLFLAIENDHENSIPYNVVASILFNWFERDPAALLELLTKQRQKTDKSHAPKIDRIIKIVKTWKEAGA